MIAAYLISVLLLVLTLLFFVYRKWENSSYVKTIDLIPGPPKQFFVGNALALPKETNEILQTIHSKWVKQYGKIFRVWLGLRPFVMTSSAVLIEKMMTSNTFIDKKDAYSILTPWLGEGLLLASGNKWKKNRRLLTPAFHFQILDNFFDVFNKNADILCEQLIKANTSIKGDSVEDIDVFPYLKRCALDIICEAAMGIQVNAQLEDSEYIRNVQRISEIVVERFFSFGHFMPDWMYECTTSGREHKKILKQIHDFTSKVIRERKVEIALEDEILPEEDTSEVSNRSKKRRAFLDLMLLANKNGVELSDLEIRNEVDTFMFEGHDTTASALVWFLYCMAINPKHQALVQEELNEVFGGSDRPCTIEDTTKLKYLECCIKESLRLYPAVPIISRYISEDFELGGYKIPVGASVVIEIYALHRNEDYFPEPDVFNPDRFQTNESIGRHAFSFLPFSAGSRNCIGQRFAMFEEKVLASSLLRRFKFSYDIAKHGPPKANADLVLKPRDGMPLQIASYLQ
ncbi:cytochrome P450 4C1-like isoform X1 [Daphnia pulicaria]|uniref:cytochrome P450 4C1-like isoform X1 n=1 Tax=Daphnia pulicaria TaxID=35523 RepID=UPI001EEA6447|nr:cytochrome P450 4C1-like isoform X1 [Daphnia pulicaria]